MRHQKWADLFTAVCFVGFLALALAATLLRPKSGYSYYENRSLARPAELTLETLLDGSFPACVEPVLQDHAVGRNTLLKTFAWADLRLFHRPVVNETVPSGDLLLGWNRYEIVDPAAITQQAQAMADQLSRLQDIIQSYGGHFYYMAVPGQYTYYEDAYPDYLNSRSAYTARELPSFAQAMADRGVPLIDLGEILSQEGAPAEWYSATDYHYQFGGALAAYRAILDRVNQDLGLDLTVLEGDALRQETLPNPYLGSRARKVFGLWPASERLTIGLPADPIPFTRFDNGSQGAAQVYDLPPDDVQPVLYSLYMGGDIGETVIDTGRPELPSILIYGDSFTNPVECLMYYSFDQMRSVDLRHYKDMTLADYIAAYQPDIVVGIRDYEALLSQDYNGNLFQIQP